MKRFAARRRQARPPNSRRVSTYGRQLIEEDDVRAVTDVLRSDYLTTGPMVTTLERALVEVSGASDCVVVGSGTAGLHLAAIAGGLSQGDLAIVPSVSFVATANAARYVGAEVAFADVDPDTGLMRPSDLEEVLSRNRGRKPSAVFPVHMEGQCADMDRIIEIAAANDLVVIEDASHALGGVRLCVDGSEKPIGACEHKGMAVFSMHPVKTIAMGEGGAIAVADSRTAERLRHLRSHGITRSPDEFVLADAAFDLSGTVNPWHYEQTELGFNYRATEMQCALGVSQMKKLRRFTEHRRTLRARYVELLASLYPVVRPVPEVPWCRPAWHLMVVLIDFPATGSTRAEIMRALSAAGVGTQVHYIPIHRQPYYRGRYGEITLPGAESYFSRCLSLPLHAGMISEDVDAVVDTLADVVGLATDI